MYHFVLQPCHLPLPDRRMFNNFAYRTNSKYESNHVWIFGDVLTALVE